MKDTPIEGLWKRFEEKAIPPEATAAQRDAMRDAFFFGAHGLFMLIAAYQTEAREMIERKEDTTEVAHKFAKLLSDEFRAFFEECEETVAANDQKH